MKMNKPAKARRIVTSLEQLVRTVQDSAHSDAEAVAVLTLILNTGRAALLTDPSELEDLAA